jgi:heat shock protein HslJ
MPDLLDQLRDYADALAETVEPVSAATAMTTEPPIGVEARIRRSRWRWRVAAAAAVVVVLAGVVAVQARDGRVPWLSRMGVAGQLDGRTFRASTISIDGGPPVAASGTITFDDSGVAAHACNTVAGPFTVEGGRLLADRFLSTAINCGDVPSADAWEDVVAQSPTVTLVDDRLTLTAGTTVLELVDQATAVPSDTFSGIDWRLEMIAVGTATSSIPPADGTTAEVPTITFAPTPPGADSATFTGTDACNTFGGSYRADVGTITFSDQLDRTTRGCPAGMEPFATAMSAVLRDTATYERERDLLRISKDGMTLVLRKAG